MAKEHCLDGVMVGRALVGNPWFFLAAPKPNGEGGTGYEPSVRERLDAVLEHAEIFSELQKQDTARKFDSMKKHFHAYIKNFVGAKELRDSIMAIKNIRDLEKIIGIYVKKLI